MLSFDKKNVLGTERERQGWKMNVLRREGTPGEKNERAGRVQATRHGGLTVPLRRVRWSAHKKGGVSKSSPNLAGYACNDASERDTDRSWVNHTHFPHVHVVPTGTNYHSKKHDVHLSHDHPSQLAPTSYPGPLEALRPGTFLSKTR